MQAWPCWQTQKPCEYEEGRKMTFHLVFPRPQLAALKAKKTSRKDLLLARFYCLRMVFVQTTKQIYRDLLQHVQSLPVLRSSVEERWWEISYIWSFVSPENITFVGRSGDTGMDGEVRSCHWEKKQNHQGMARKWIAWMIILAFPTHPSHLTVLNLSRLTASLVSRWAPQGPEPALPGGISIPNPAWDMWAIPQTPPLPTRNTTSRIFSLQPHLPVTCSCKHILCVLKNLWSPC